MPVESEAVYISQAAARRWFGWQPEEPSPPDRLVRGKIKNPDRPPLPSREEEVAEEAARARLAGLREVLRSAGATLRSEASDNTAEWCLGDLFVYLTRAGGWTLQRRGGKLLTRGTDPQRLADWLA